MMLARRSKTEKAEGRHTQHTLCVILGPFAPCTTVRRPSSTEATASVPMKRRADIIMVVFVVVLRGSEKDFCPRDRVRNISFRLSLRALNLRVPPVMA